MKITPLDIQQQQFKKKSGRYESSEVDAFLDMVRLELEELTRENSNQDDQIKKLKSELSELKGQEKLLKEAILTTQKVSEDIKKQAHKEAEIILAEANLKAERIHDQANVDVQRIHDEIADLRRERIQLETQFRAILEAHMKMLDAYSESSKSADSEAEKVKVLGKK